MAVLMGIDMRPLAKVFGVPETVLRWQLRVRYAGEPAVCVEFGLQPAEGDWKQIKHYVVRDTDGKPLCPIGNKALSNLANWCGIQDSNRDWVMEVDHEECVTTITERNLVYTKSDKLPELPDSATWTFEPK